MKKKYSFVAYLLLTYKTTKMESQILNEELKQFELVETEMEKVKGGTGEGYQIQYTPLSNVGAEIELK